MDLARAIYLWYACAQAGALSGCWRRSLIGAYPFFTALLAVNLVQFAVLCPFPPRSVQYYEIYGYSAWLVLVLQIAAACEGWTISTHLQYPKIGRVANWLACYAVIVGIAGAFMVGLAGFNVLSLEHLARIQTWHVITARYVSTVLFCVCALAWTLNSWLDEGVQPNARRHVAILSGVFGAQAIGFLLISNYRALAAIAGVAFIGCQAVLIALWPVIMRSEGESREFRERLGDTAILDRLPGLTKRVISALD